MTASTKQPRAAEARGSDPEKPERLRRIHDRLDELVPEDAARRFNEKLGELAERDPQAAALLERLTRQD
ncbi:MAG: hypothetical protein RIF41_22415 [Polyangiaceae bacterium]